MSHKYLSSINVSSFVNLLICGSVWIISTDSCSLALILSFTVSHPLLLTLLTTVFISVIVLYGFKISIAYFFVILIFLLRFPTHGAIFIIFVFNSLNRVCIIWVFSVALKFLSAKFCLWTSSYSVFTKYFLFSAQIWVTLPCFCKPHNFFLLKTAHFRQWIIATMNFFPECYHCCFCFLLYLSLA